MPGVSRVALRFGSNLCRFRDDETRRRALFIVERHQIGGYLSRSGTITGSMAHHDAIPAVRLPNRMGSNNVLISGGTVLQARHSRLFAVAHLSRCTHGTGSRLYEESMAKPVLTAAVAFAH